MKALAIDLGGSHATCAVVENDKVTASETIPIESARSLKSMLPLFSQTLRELAKTSGTNVSMCAGLAFGFCGIVNTRTGRVLSTNEKYADAPALDLPQWSHESFNLPLKLENDARLALLGERYTGAARGCDDVVMITLGTGIGGAAMIGGRLLRGKHFQAGCLGGHFPVVVCGRKCNCGNVGCVEAEASTWSLPEISRAWNGFAESSLAREEQIDFAKLFQHAEDGDMVAREIQARCLNVWAAGAVAMIHAYDPEVIVFGGGVMKSAAHVLPFIESYVAAHAWTPWGKVRVRAAKLNEAALLGAIPLLQEPL